MSDRTCPPTIISVSNLGIALFSTLCLTRYLYLTYKDRQTLTSSLAAKEEKSDLHKLAVSGAILPPLPPAVKSVLNGSDLLFLSTCEGTEPHISLMKFCYLPEEEVVIISTNRKTKKYEFLTKQNKVAVLVHDFSPKVGESMGNCTYSITLNGNCFESPLSDVKTEYYRNKHLEKNSHYEQFIVGDDIAIIKINIISARICNVRDNVEHWNVNDSNKDC